MFMLKTLNVVLIMLQLSNSLCDTGSSHNFQPINQTKSKNISSLCPTWTYLNDNTSECVCGDRMNGVVLCNDSNTILLWCLSSNNLAPSMCLLTCHCMSYNERFDTVIMGECPYLCTSHYYYHIPDSYNQLNTTCSTVIQQNRTGQLCSKCIEGYICPFCIFLWDSVC